MEVLMVVALWNMTPSGLAVSIIKADGGGSKLHLRQTIWRHIPQGRISAMMIVVTRLVMVL
jgi:hypothetical protein